MYQTVCVKSDTGKKFVRKEPLFSRNYIGISEQIAFDINLAVIKGNLDSCFSCTGKALEVAYSVQINTLMDSIFSIYGDEPSLVFWFSVIPKDETPKLQKLPLAWKPKIFDQIVSSSSVPIFS